MKFPKETAFRFQEYHSKLPFFFLGSAGFEAMNKEVNNSQERRLRTVNERVPVGNIFYMIAELGKHLISRTSVKIV